MLKAQILIIVLLFSVTSALHSQWNNEWSSSQLSSSATSGFVNFDQNPDGTWESRVYTLDTLKFVVMTSGYSTTPEFTYTFTDAERFAGQLIYSLEADLTGDGITEFYVLGQYGTTDFYRQAFKILDITTGSTIFLKDDASFYYSYPTIWDPDNDGTFECTFAEYDYPNFAGYTFQSYNTGVSLTGVASEVFEPRFELNQNYPNPFNPSTKISFIAPSYSKVKVEIFDVKGALVTTLANDYFESGYHELRWNARNHNGKKVSSGAYFYKVSTDNLTATKKMIFIK